jgi:hypothetical protein
MTWRPQALFIPLSRQDARAASRHHPGLSKEKITNGRNRQDNYRDQGRERPQTSKLAVCHPELEERKVFQALPVLVRHSL